jgi:hypothetical protein
MPILHEANTHPDASVANDPHDVALRRLEPQYGGLSPTTPGGFTHLLVAVDKFSKWIEA